MTQSLQKSNGINLSIEKIYLKNYMQITHWSRAFWTALFATALGYPMDPKINDQFNYKRFYLDIQHILPCQKCRKHYRANLKKLPINPFLRGGRDSLFAWVLRMHNIINNDLGKPALSASQAMRKYFPEMSLIEAKELGQKISPLMKKFPHPQHQADARPVDVQEGGADNNNLLMVGVGLSSVALMLYLLK